MAAPLTTRSLRRMGRPFFVVAGPCVVESLDHALFMAERLQEIGSATGVPVIFKASYDKANRQELGSFRGPGLEEGLEVLRRVKEATGSLILTDVHETSEVDAVAEVADVLQIPALLCRQTDLITRAAETGRVVNIKKGQFASAHTAVLASEKARSSQMLAGTVEGWEGERWAGGPAGVILTERGSMFGYDDIVVDPRNLVRMREGDFGDCLVMQDVTHSVQRTGGGAGQSVGSPEFVPVIARMAAAVGVHGLFFEVHDAPADAPCDGRSMLQLDRLQPLLEELVAIADASKGLDSGSEWERGVDRSGEVQTSEDKELSGFVSIGVVDEEGGDVEEGRGNDEDSDGSVTASDTDSESKPGAGRFDPRHLLDWLEAHESSDSSDDENSDSNSEDEDEADIEDDADEDDEDDGKIEVELKYGEDGEVFIVSTGADQTVYNPATEEPMGTWDNTTSSVTPLS